MPAYEHYIVFTKDSQRQLNEKAITNNVSHILGVNNKSLKARGWTVVIHDVSQYRQQNWKQRPLLDDSPNEYQYELHFMAVYAGDQEPGKTELRAILKTMNTRSTHPLGGRWSISTVDGDEYTVSDDGDRVTTKDFVAYTDVDIPED